MDEKLKGDLLEQYKSLPKEIQTALSSVDLGQKIQEIGKKNGLLIDQIGTLETETILILLGVEPLIDYTKNIARELQITNDKATAIANDANDSVFKNIREALKKISESQEFGGEETQFTENTSKPNDMPNREDIMAGIENPETISGREETVSISELEKNAPDQIDLEIEKEETNPEIKNSSEVTIPIKKIPTVSIEDKMKGVVVMPKDRVIIKEQSKLPEKTSMDPYREPTE